MLKKFIFVLPLLAILLSGCDFTSDDVAIQTMEIADFSKLSLELYGDVEISQGEVYSLEIEGPEKMLNEIEVKEELGTLTLKTSRWITSSDPLKISISAPNIESIYATNNTNLFMNDWQISEMYLSLSENAKLKGENFVIENLMMHLVQNSVSELTGAVENFDLKISSPSKYLGKNFVAKNMSLEHNSLTDAELNVTEKLSLKILSKGNVLQAGAAEPQVEFSSVEDVGKVLDFAGNILAQLCTNYAADNCPATCQLCPPCPECSSLLCQTKEACSNLGFEEGWLK